MLRDEATILDMLTAGRRVVEFLRGQDQNSFLSDHKTQAAVLHQLLLLGEAARRLSAEFRAQHSQMPWKAIAGLRDRLIHAYNVDLTLVWATCQREIPELIKFLEPLAPPPPGSEP